jgi:putative transposase
VKSINQWYNKLYAKYQHIATRFTHPLMPKRLLSLQRQRENQLTDYLHKTSRLLIDYCVATQVATLVIGYNSGWKQRCRLGKRNTQNFGQIPFYRLVQMLEYKAQRVGIQVVRVTEAYTSQQCSRCGLRRKANRVSRGLYICIRCGMRINADLNAAQNILQNYVSSRSTAQVVLRTHRFIRSVCSPDSRCVAHLVPTVMSVS